MKKPQWVSSRELSNLWGVPLRTVQSWASNNKIPGQVKFGNHWRFNLEKVEKAYLRKSFLNKPKVGAK